MMVLVPVSFASPSTLELLHEAEVEQLDPRRARRPAGRHDVRGLDVAMDGADLVRASMSAPTAMRKIRTTRPAGCAPDGHDALERRAVEEPIA